MWSRNPCVITTPRHRIHEWGDSSQRRNDRQLFQAIASIASWVSAGDRRLPEIDAGLIPSGVYEIGANAASVP